MTLEIIKDPKQTKYQRIYTHALVEEVYDDALKCIKDYYDYSAKKDYDVTQTYETFDILCIENML